MNTPKPALLFLIALASAGGGCESPAAAVQAPRPVSGSGGMSDPEEACPGGEYRGDSGDCQKISSCSAGRYVLSEPTEDSDRVCAVCPDDTYTDREDAAECRTMRDCPPGQYAPLRQLNDADRACMPCPAETFTDLPNLRVCIPWTACQPDEWESTSPTLTSDRVCSPATSCTPGTYVARDAAGTEDRECAQCPEGTVSDTADAVMCRRLRDCAPDEWSGPDRHFQERTCIDFSTRSDDCDFPGILGDSAEVDWPHPDRPASDLTIDSVESRAVAFSQGDGWIWLEGDGSTFALNDGSAWHDEKRSRRKVKVLEATAEGDRLRYLLHAASSELLSLWAVSEKHSTNARLDLLAPLVLEAALGSQTATIEAAVLVAEDFPYPFYADGRYHFLSAPRCSIVQLSVTYTLMDDSVFDRATFAVSGLEYKVEMRVDFTNPRTE